MYEHFILACFEQGCLCIFPCHICRNLQSLAEKLGHQCAWNVVLEDCKGWSKTLFVSKVNPAKDEQTKNIYILQYDG